MGPDKMTRFKQSAYVERPARHMHHIQLQLFVTTGFSIIQRSV